MTATGQNHAAAALERLAEDLDQLRQQFTTRTAGLSSTHVQVVTRQLTALTDQVRRQARQERHPAGPTHR